MTDIDSDGPEGSFETADKDDELESDSSLLSILDEKNKLIASLQRQLQNQKLQLMYYMRKERNYAKLVELSATCSPENFEDSLPILLSLEHFRKENGMKSTLFRLYEYMENLDRKLNKSIDCQECILRKIIEQFCLVMKNRAKFNVDFKIIQPMQQNLYVDLFNSLIETTVRLRKRLDSFRMCCNRLLLIEDERNNLIEQVVALPANEKFNCNFLMTIKQDNIELERKIQLLTRKQNFINSDVEDADDLDQNLSTIQKKFKTAVNESENITSISDLIKQLNIDAKDLLQVAEKRYNKNDTLVNCATKFIRLVLNEEKIHENAYTQEELDAIQAIKKEVEEFKQRSKDKYHKLQMEGDDLKKTFIELLTEKNKLKIANIYLKFRVEKLQKHYDNDISTLKQEKSNLETQLQDLEELRKSYTKLLIMPDLENSSKQNEILAHTIGHLEQKLLLMKEIIQKQNKEISIQSEFIENIKNQNKTSQASSTIVSIDGSDSKRPFEANDFKDIIMGELSRYIERKKAQGDADGDGAERQWIVAFGNKELQEVAKEIVETVVKKLVKQNEGNAKPSDESVIMCDCSSESTGAFCEPLQKSKEAAENRYSRNIEVLVQNNLLLNSSSDECNLDTK